MVEDSAIASTSKKVKKLPVMEIFGPTIQGEGSMIGVNTTFIRFGLCDYKCIMCDSMHAVDPLRVKQNAMWLTPKEIVDKLLGYQATSAHILQSHWVTLSGGNPCIHDLSELLMRIRGLDITHGYVRVAVETQGTFNPDWLGMCDVITVSPKSPGMGEAFEQNKFLDFLLKWKNHVGFNCKVVVFSQQDLEFAQYVNNLMIDEGLADSMYLSLGNPYPPGKDSGLSEDELKLELMKQYSILSEDLLKMPHMANVKFLPQLHVLAWANKQGV